MWLNKRSLFKLKYYHPNYQIASFFFCPWTKWLYIFFVSSQVVDGEVGFPKMKDTKLTEIYSHRYGIQNSWLWLWYKIPTHTQTHMRYTKYTNFRDGQLIGLRHWKAQTSYACRTSDCKTLSSLAFNHLIITTAELIYVQHYRSRAETDSLLAWRGWRVKNYLY